MSETFSSGMQKQTLWSRDSDSEVSLAQSVSGTEFLDLI